MVSSQSSTLLEVNDRQHDDLDDGMEKHILLDGVGTVRVRRGGGGSGRSEEEKNSRSPRGTLDRAIDEASKRASMQTANNIIERSDEQWSERIRLLVAAQDKKYDERFNRVDEKTDQNTKAINELREEIRHMKSGVGRGIARGYDMGSDTGLSASGGSRHLPSKVILKGYCPF